MMFKKIVITLTVILCSIDLVDAQSKQSISGYVFDKDNNPIENARAVLLKNGIGAYSDQFGLYSFRSSVKEGDTLQYSALGYKPNIVIYRGADLNNVVLQEDNQQIESVVVYGRQNINDIDVRAKTGQVEQIDMQIVKAKPTTNIALALQGTVPGLVVTNIGELGSEPTVRIRGNSSLRDGNLANEPLYVLDGKIISPQTFYELNPNDISEISVLKDAVATALYGIKAANGVLELTSVRGVNQPATINYSAEVGVTLRGDKGAEMMTSEEKLQLEYLMGANGGASSAPGYRYSEEFIRKYNPNAANIDALIANGQAKLDSLKGINTDWFNYLIRPNYFQRHNLSVRGGNDEGVYYVSANYTSQGGRVEGNDMQRMSLMANYDHKIADIGYLMFSANAGYGITNTPNGMTNDITSLAYTLNPYESPEGGELISYPGKKYSDLINQFSGTSNSTTVGGSASVNLTPLPGLDISAVAGIDFLLSKNVQITPGTAFSEQYVAEIERGKYYELKGTSTTFTSGIRANYTKTFNEKHEINLGANYDYYYDNLDNISITGYGIGRLTTASAINQSLEGNRKPRVGATKMQTSQMGIGGLVGYSFDRTYDIFATYKADASSLLPANKRWNSAWAIGAAWTISQYDFLNDSKVITNLDVKASYGQTANLNGVGVASTVATFSYSQDFYGNQRLLELQGIYNPDLKPEQTNTLNWGLNLTLFKNWSVDLTYYERTTHQALLDVPIPSSTGFTFLKRNVGVLENNGVEMNLFGHLLRTDDFGITLGASIAYNRNKVVDLYYSDKIYVDEESLVPTYEVGQPYDIIYGLQSLGINPMTGLPTFLSGIGEQIDADTKISREDLQVLGYSTPPISGSIRFGISYKQFDLNANFYYTMGGSKSYNYNEYVRDDSNVNKNAIAGQVDKMWFKPGDQMKEYYTPYHFSSNLVLYPNSDVVQRNDYIRLSMLSLRYRPTVQWLKHTSIALQASNLFTITDFKYADPESGSIFGTPQPTITLNLSLYF